LSFCLPCLAADLATSPPVITNQPLSQLVAAGDTVRLSVRARDGAAWQWQKDGSDLAGRTNASLVLSNVTPADAGTYTVVVMNDCGAVTSAPALLRLKSEVPYSTLLVYFGKLSGLPLDWWFEGWSWSTNTIFIPHDFSHTIIGSEGQVAMHWTTDKTNAAFILDWTPDKNSPWYPFHVVTWTNTSGGRVSWVNSRWLTNNPGYFRAHEKLPGDLFSTTYPP
jgi:hypothetical protein